MERHLINDSNGDSLGDMTPTEIRELIEKLAIESKHSGNEDEGVKELNNVHLEAQISELTKAVILLTQEKLVGKKPCGICLKNEHPTNMCPILQEDVARVKAPPNFYQKNYQQRQQFQPPPGFQHQNFQNLNYQYQNTHQQRSSSSVALEDIVKSLSMSTQAFQGNYN
uniref:Uncharacterized protein n=1 Tax=Lactuca sativa TaxID=4236 RepID=A0A9R1VF82_LACSA|nr:hypothetical protein LSAT_V11C500258570 [Lactuca sativa]